MYACAHCTLAFQCFQVWDNLLCICSKYNTAIYANICLYRAWRFSFNGLSPWKNISSHSSRFTLDRSDMELICWLLPSKIIFDMSSFFKESWLISSSKLLGHFSTLHWPDYSFSWPLLSPYSTLVVVVTLNFDGCKCFLFFPWMLLWCCSWLSILPKSAQISCRTL